MGRSRYRGLPWYALNCWRITGGITRKSLTDGPFAIVAWQLGRTADSTFDVMIEWRPEAGIKGGKIAEEKQRFKSFFAVFTTH
ncbi:hypothetical protein [Paraburkholderia sp. BL23I1N1]|uniref:hypothetical protein n=1 Tax=Paraburkholderia sp. BL23I1N1 TaxID=1938802 RepID=UPI000E7514B8|nr:hypothetical protein [Paraburkholderia sp. BL23I1N1]